MSFSLDLSKFAGLTEKKMVTTVKRTFIGLSSDIIDSTPIDSGRLRNNWFPDVNKFSDKTTKRTGKEGTARKNDVIRVGNKFELGDTVTLTNNLIYAKDIEFGLYGDGPLTIGGFSKKAPAGMVGINVIRWKSIVDEQARRLS